MAQTRLQHLKRKFGKNISFKKDYEKVMNEYKELNHMQAITEHEADEIGYFLPHHAVIKETSTTTKLRVVFDASAKTTSGESLND